MKHSAVNAYVRQLCSLGLDGQTVIPELLKALHHVVPSDSNAFFWTDDRVEMANLYAEALLPPEVMDLYFREFYNKREREAKNGFSDAFLSPSTASQVFSPQLTDAFYQSDYYNLIWRRFDAHHVLHGVIRERGRNVGLLSLYRTRSDPPFSPQDETRLAEIVGYIARGLRLAPGTTADDPTEQHLDSEQHGFLVIDSRGRIQLASPQAARLLFLATHDRIAPDTVQNYGEVPAQLTDLCKQMANLSGAGALPPMLRLENSWGRFVVESCWLDGPDSRAGTSIGISIQYQEPLLLRVLSRMRGLPLSTKQREVCLLLAKQSSHAEIARCLNVSLNTVNYHVREIYNKLGVHDRTGMLSRILMDLPGSHPAASPALPPPNARALDGKRFPAWAARPRPAASKSHH